MSYFTINTNITDSANYASNRIEFNTANNNYIDFHKSNNNIDYTNYKEANIIMKVFILTFLVLILSFIIFCIITTSTN